LYCCIESYGFKAIGTDANRGFGGLFLYHSAFYKVIYSLNLDLANKCVPLKISTAPLFYIIKHKKTVDKSIVFLYLEFMILL